MATPTAFKNWPKSLAPSYGPYRAVLDRWIDGDTGLFLVDKGFGPPEFVEIRVEGLSTADDPHPEADEATDFANALAPPGSRALLHTTGARIRATFTRWVARVELEHGLDYAEAMTAAGHHRPDLSR